ncbi:MAG: L,D-transpeptidase family protein [Ferruginibacter sp.]|nr:L,D-transpeptidase family protein [Chitinophagaceae bacterium]
MSNAPRQFRYFAICIIFLALSCNNRRSGEDKNLVTNPGAMNEEVSGQMKKALNIAAAQAGNIDDSTGIAFYQIVEQFYKKGDFQPVWSSAAKWEPLADSLYRFIKDAENEGLFPNDYHFNLLKVLKDTLDRDSIARMNADFWTKAELLLTDGFMHLIKDLKQGRLQPDSLSLNKDSVLVDKFFIATLNDMLEKKDFSGTLISVQPKHKNYWELKKGIKKFVDSMDRRVFTHIVYPFKRGDVKDSLYFIKLLQKRLAESNCISPAAKLPDSAALATAIKKYQLQKGLKADGKYGKNIVAALNSNDVERFKRIAITLDKYKQLPPKMPDKYIWVNLPGYYLHLVNADTIVFESKVICGRPETRTPLLTSEISDIITYPTWTVPTSIIVKQYLPRLKNNPNYISRLGLKLMNNKGEVINPGSVNWSKYSRGIPYRVVQGSGDNNSLGVIKFNFDNPYAVYLHDTNQRYLFKNASRALSHGCVRVQEWEKLAYYIAGNDSILSKRRDSLKYTADSIRSWIAQKERHHIDVKNHIALYIRYFSCEGKKGEVIFYEDIYGEDRQLMEKYFAKK